MQYVRGLCYRMSLTHFVMRRLNVIGLGESVLRWNHLVFRGERQACCASWIRTLIAPLSRSPDPAELKISVIWHSLAQIYAPNCVRAHTHRQAPTDLRQHFPLHEDLHNFNKAKYKTLQGQSKHIRCEKSVTVWESATLFVCSRQSVEVLNNNHQLLRRGTKFVSQTQQSTKLSNCITDHGIVRLKKVNGTKRKVLPWIYS